MEDRTSGDPDNLPPIVILLLVCDLVTSDVVVLLLNGFGVIGFRDGMWMPVRWDRDSALSTRDDEMTKVLPFCTIEPVFQSLKKRWVNEALT